MNNEHSESNELSGTTASGQHGWLSTSAIVLAWSTVTVLLGLLLWVAGDVLLLIFTGLLGAVFLINVSRLVQQTTKLSYAWSLSLILGALLLAFSLLFGFFATQLVTEAEQLFKTLDSTWQQLQGSLKKYDLFTQLSKLKPLEELKNVRTEWFNRIAGAFSSTMGVLSSLLLILFIAIFTAADPGLYRRGLLHMVPMDRRPRTSEVLDETGSKLWWWVIGQLLSMSAVGLATGFGLWLLGIPFAATLGLLSGLLTFIPNFGPIISAVPAVLIGSTNGVMQAVYVIALYVGVQAVESNLLTPLIQQRNVKLPPVVNVCTQLLMGVLFGLMGLIVAAPLAVVVMVFVQKFYVEDYLGDHSLSNNEQDESLEA